MIMRQQLTGTDINANFNTTKYGMYYVIRNLESRSKGSEKKLQHSFTTYQ